jgi:hypothetical protein
MNTALIALVICGLSFAAGSWGGIEWQRGREALAMKAAQAELKAAQEAASVIAMAHANNTAAISRQLGNARVQLRDLSSGRDCLSADAVSLLNSAVAVPNAAGQPASQARAAATDQDVGDALAVCRFAHRQLSDQLNAILDIEDTRH